MSAKHAPASIEHSGFMGRKGQPILRAADLRCCCAGSCGGVAVSRTPGRWAVKPDRMLRATVIAFDGNAVAVTTGDASRDEHIARAEMIVKACNAHDELVAALRSGIESMEQLVRLNRLPAGENNAGLRDMRAALAKVSL